MYWEVPWWFPGYYDVVAEGEQNMNVMKANMKELYFKRQDMFPLGNYFNRLKEFYNKLEELRQTEFEL